LLPALLFLGRVQRHIVAGLTFGAVAAAEGSNGTVKSNGRAGFLPMHTNAFDRIFIGTVIFVALHLLRMPLLKAHIPLNVATILSLLIGAIIVARG
jgi:predicted small integral membrane protein